MLSICLNSRFPAIYWGADQVLLYNDAWRPIVGDKHPWALDRPAYEVWSEIWGDIGSELALWEKIVLLVSNAFKFTFEGEITISLRAVNNQVELEVRDMGTKLPAEELPEIFEQFH